MHVNIAGIELKSVINLLLEELMENFNALFLHLAGQWMLLCYYRHW